MEVNSINNQLNALASSSQNSLEKVATGLSINDAQNNAPSLSIADSLKVQRSDLAQSLQNINSGLAVTSIANEGVNSQIDILSSMRTKTLEAMDESASQETKDSIQNQLQVMMQDYQNIASSTTYEGQSLLTNPTGETQFNVSTSDNTIAIKLPSTDTLGEELQTLLNDFSSDGLTNILNKIDTNVDQLQNIQNDFGTTSQQLQDQAKNTISSQINNARANSTLTDIDFGSQVSDFSKSSIMSQMGYLAVTQANAVQEQNIRLLS